MGKARAPAPLVDALLREAGVAPHWSYVGVASAGRVNTTTVIERPDGQRFAVRVYGWPFDGESPFDRRAKELVWAERLAAAGVPVARFAAVADVDGAEGALLEWIDGELLGSVAAREPREDLEEAWRGAGAALRTAHGIDPGVGGQGFLTADGLVPFEEGTFAARIVDETVARARRLHGPPGDGHVDADRFEALAPALARELARAPSGLGHSDSNPWNGMIARGRDGRWRFRAWLDWEFAWVADPAYDHVRATVQRFADIGPTPDSYWEGYGSRPDPLPFAAYALHLVLWKAEERLDGQDSPETRRFWSMLPTVTDRVIGLERALGV